MHEARGTIRDRLLRQGYMLVGKDTSVKLCHWVREALFYHRACYKQQFYGIKSHRCIQMTPVTKYCTENCRFCWRIHDYDDIRGLREYISQIKRQSGFTEEQKKNADMPEQLLQNIIEAQRKLVSGFKGDSRCDLRMWNESREPNQIAISLNGEPTLYPFLGEFIAHAKSKGFTTFLVSNGTIPETLRNLNSLPTQLYITVAAPNEEIFNKLVIPLIPDAWQRLLETLKYLNSITTKTVIRHTLVESWNMCNEEEYAKLDMLAEPTYIECKAYMFVGESRKRLDISCMPSHERVREFAENLAALTGYKIVNENRDSRVVLLSRG